MHVDMKHIVKVVLITIVILAVCFGLYILSDHWDAPYLRFLNYAIIGAASGIYAGPRLAPEVDKEKYRMTPRKWKIVVICILLGSGVMAWLFEGRLW